MKLLILYLLPGISTAAMLVREDGHQIQRKDFWLLLLVVFLWPLAGCIWLSDAVEGLHTRWLKSPAYARWDAWWNKPMRKRPTART